MAQYKVPQDVEADDKLLGPFSFRQFVYLMIAGGLIALAVGLFQLFPLLAILPLPPVLFFAALALPLKKDQPMETYLVALVSFYLKPRKRVWTPGQKESTILITAPKIVEASRTRDITGEEATHRLSFLANIVDTGGYAIKGAGSNPMREDLIAEANAATDMFDNARFNNLGSSIARDENERHAEVIRGMREAILKNESIESGGGTPLIQKRSDTPEGMKVVEPTKVNTGPDFSSSVVVMPGVPVASGAGPSESVATSATSGTSGAGAAEVVEKSAEKAPPTPPKASIIELANNPDFSIATIAKEAKRINERDDSEVFISLH